ncbi:MAG: hypothetical protein BKP49_01945 [Treponema sp. CETP13]|nr:MAG: hypothetical protein BKP49_01945 [Treponema sp. CETP13]
MPNNNKKTRFFCEYCNHEVDNDAMFCPYCGRFFSSVKCPKCGYTGSHVEFINGCSKCGYAMEDVQKKRQKAPKNKKNSKKLGKTQKHDDSLPFWVYIIALILLLILLFITKTYL